MARKKLTREDKLTAIRQYSEYYQGENKVDLNRLDSLTDDQVNRQYLRITGSVRRRSKNINYLDGERIVLNQLNEAYKTLSTITVEHVEETSLDGMLAVQGAFNSLVDKLDQLRQLLEEQKKVVLQSSEMAKPVSLNTRQIAIAE